MEVLEHNLASFFDGMQYYLEISHEARQSLASAVAPSFSVFDYVQPDENRLSTIIADLLDPNGKHGQGSTFLMNFLQQLHMANKQFTSPDDWSARAERARVVNEAATSFLTNAARRIDIRIELPPQCSDESRFGIGIENKPWAGEQDRQLADYRDELERRYDDQFILVFLTRRGRKPTSLSSEEWKNLEREGRAVILDYSVHVHAWLVACWQRCRADKIRHFLGDFAQYVQVHLGSVEGEEGADDGRS